MNTSTGASDSSAGMSRRESLKMFAAAASAVALNKTLMADDEPLDKKYIDAHSHIWTRDVERYPLAEGTTLDDLQPPSFTAEELLKTARPEGVGRVVLIAHHKFYAYDNSYMTDAAKHYPGVFKVVGMIDESKPHPDVAMRRLLKQHVTGFRIVPWIRGEDKWLASDGMALMWRTAADTRQAICCLINPSDLPAVDGMCERFADTPVVIDHFARIGVDGTIGEGDLKNLCRLARHKHTHVKISAYYALGKKKPPYLDLAGMIRRVLDAFGPERTMWASDSPYQLDGENTYRASISLVRDKLDFLSDGDRQWLLRKTAEKVYFS